MFWLGDLNYRVDLDRKMTDNILSLPNAEAIKVMKIGEDFKRIKIVGGHLYFNLLQDFFCSIMSHFQINCKINFVTQLGAFKKIKT